MHPHESFLGLVTLTQRAYTANEAPSVYQVPLPNAVILSFYKGGDDRLKITAFYCVPHAHAARRVYSRVMVWVYLSVPDSSLSLASCR